MSSRRPGDPRELRHWYWRLVLLEYRSPRRWLAGVGRVVARPFAVARRTLDAAVRYGPAVRRRFGVSVVRQAALLWWDGMRCSLRPADWYRNQLYLPSERHRVDDIIPTRINYRLLSSLDRGADGELARITSQKVRFGEWCRAHGFPSAESIAVVTPDEVPEPSALPPCDLFSKKTRGSGGDGAALWRWAGDGRWLGDDDRPRDARQLLEELRGQTGPTWNVVVQRRLRNHASLDPLARRGLCTARMMTIRWPDGRVEHGCTIFRIPLGDSPVDNMSAGGLGARVDTRTGVVVEARHGEIHLEISCDAIVVHPDTGAPIAGVKLPWWEEARALVETAHRTLGGLAIVGWDVGLTPDGPVLVEANSRPGLDLSQRWEDGPSTRSAYGLCIAEHLRLGRHYEARPVRNPAPELGEPAAPPHGWSYASPASPPDLRASRDEPADLASRTG